MEDAIKKVIGPTNHDKYDEPLAEQAAREHRHECAMFEVDILVSGTRREIYHIVAASKEAAIEKAMNGYGLHPVNENYEPQDHTREIYAVEEMVPSDDDIAEWVGLHHHVNFSAEPDPRKAEWRTRYMEALP
jgi:hypothetical protein